MEHDHALGNIISIGTPFNIEGMLNRKGSNVQIGKENYPSKYCIQ